MCSTWKSCSLSLVKVHTQVIVVNITNKAVFEFGSNMHVHDLYRKKNIGIFCKLKYFVMRATLILSPL